MSPVNHWRSDKSIIQPRHVINFLLIIEIISDRPPNHLSYIQTMVVSLTVALQAYPSNTNSSVERVWCTSTHQGLNLVCCLVHFLFYFDSLVHSNVCVYFLPLFVPHLRWFFLCVSPVSRCWPIDPHVYWGHSTTPGASHTHSFEQLLNTEAWITCKWWNSQRSSKNKNRSSSVGSVALTVEPGSCLGVTDY